MWLRNGLRLGQLLGVIKFNQSGRVVSLHVHPAKAGDDLIPMEELNLVADQGIRENKRYFGRGRPGKPFKRQVTLVEREVLRGHAGTLGIADFAAGEVRSNIETEGIDLIGMMGREVQVGEAALRFVEARTPCHKMDALAPGLRALMEDGRQGVIAMVVRGGRVRVGDQVALMGES